MFKKVLPSIRKFFRFFAEEIWPRVVLYAIIIGFIALVIAVISAPKDGNTLIVLYAIAVRLSNEL